MMKKNYNEPTLCFLQFGKQDICTVSVGYDDGDNVKDIPESWVENK